MFSVIISSSGICLFIFFGWRWANRFFNLPCPFWMDWLMETPYMIRILGPEETVRRARIEIGQDVLDLGCGSGRIAIPISQAIGPKGRLLALDLQQGMISKLDKKLAKRNALNNIETRQADLDEITFTQQRYDRILMVMLVGELKNPDLLFGKLRSILKEDGRISVSEVLPDPHYQRKSRIRRLAKQNGFEVNEVFSSFLAYTINLSKN